MNKEYKYYIIKTDEKVKNAFYLELTENELNELKMFVKSALNYSDYYDDVTKTYEQLSLKLDFIGSVEFI